MIFKKYKIKDIVFLAIITVCRLVAGVVMLADIYQYSHQNIYIDKNSLVCKNRNI